MTLAPDQNTTSSRHFAVAAVWRIVFAYVLFGMLWILFSDRILSLFSSDSAQLMRWQTYKGWFFIAASAAMLFLLLNRSQTRQRAAQESLAASALQYRLLVDGAQDFAITLLDGAGRIVSWNAGARQITGFENDEVVGQSSAMLYTDGDVVDMVPDQHLQQARRNGRVESDGWCKRKDGSRYWGNTVLTALYRGDGTLYGFLRISRDLTERRVAEEHSHKLNRIHAVLSDVNQMIVRERSLPPLFAQTCQIAVERGGLRMAWIGLVDPTTKAVRPVAHAGVVDGYLEQLHIVLDDSPVGHFSSAQALCRGEVVIVESIADDPRMGPWREHALRLGYTASAAFPLVASGVVRGVLNLYTGEPAFFDGEVVALLLEMVGDLAFAMEMVENENRRIDAQEARRETEDRLRLAVRAGRVGLWNWELDTNRVAYSAEWKAQLGYREEEIGDSFDEWESRVHPEDLAPTLSTVRSFLAAPWPNYHAEFRLRHKDGSYRWILAQASLQMDAGGIPVRMVGSHVDITEQKAAGAEREQLIGQLEQRLTELLLLHHVAERMQRLETPEQLAADIIATLEEMVRFAYGAVLLIDPERGRLAPFALSDQKRGREFLLYDLAYVADKAPRVGEGITGWVAQHGVSVRVDDVRADPRYVAMRDDIRSEMCVPLRVDNRVIGVINVESELAGAFDAADQRLLETVAAQIAVAIYNTQLFRQVQEHSAALEARVVQRTEELSAAMEKAQTADRLKSTFLATMSHELRTPLNSIIGFTGVLLQELAGPLLPEQKKQLSMVQGSARHLLSLINDVLDISKIEAGQLELVRVPVDLHAVIDGAMRSIQPMAWRKGLAVGVTVDPAVGPILTDRRRVEQILINLLYNAVKFTERGSIDLQCIMQGDYVSVTIRDTGIGIRPEDRARLFRPFQQLEDGLARQREGTGLGLSICASLVKLMGGTITVESEWGAGSAFTFALPASESSLDGTHTGNRGQ